jgi:hypothetical protein
MPRDQPPRAFILHGPKAGDAEREVLTNREQLGQAQSDTATALVSVYRALGGGWTAPGTVTAKSDLPQKK